MVVNYITGAKISPQKVREIARRVQVIVNREFPAYSTTKMETLARTPEQQKLYQDVGKLYSWHIRPEYTDLDNPLDYYKALVKLTKTGEFEKHTYLSKCENPPKWYTALVSLVKQKKIANCSEQARLAHLVLGLNGIQGKFCTLYNGLQGVDHAVTIITENPNEKFFLKKLNEMGNTFIVDPWLKFSGRANEFAEACIKDFNKTLGLQKSGHIIANPQDMLLEGNNIEAVPVTREVIEYFSKHYPQLFINNLK